MQTLTQLLGLIVPPGKNTVEFTVDFGRTVTDWYQGHVLKEAM